MNPKRFPSTGCAHHRRRSQPARTVQTPTIHSLWTQVIHRKHGHIHSTPTEPVRDELASTQSVPEPDFEQAFERRYPMPTDAEEWRQRYLAAIAVQLALVEYLGDPDATTAGVMRILAGVDIEKDN